jgi:hypothetical protein
LLTGVVNTGGKFITGVHCSSLSLMPLINFVVGDNDTGDNCSAGVNNTGDKFIAGINDTAYD